MTYSWIRPRFPFFSSITNASFSASIPAGSWTKPPESESVTGRAPRSMQLLDRVLRDVAAAGDEAGLALEAVAAGAEHLLGEVDRAVAGRLGADQGAAPLECLAREDAGELVLDALVLPEEVADLAATDADVAGGDVRELPDVPLQLGHERLAEAHHLGVGLVLRVEVGAALAAAHRQRRERVLQHLLEGEELQQPDVDARMEAQPTLEGSDRARHLDAVAAVDLDLAGVVDPGHAEDDDALRLDEPLEDLVLHVLGVALEHGGERLHDFADGLVELHLAGVLHPHVGHQLFCVRAPEHRSLLAIDVSADFAVPSIACADTGVIGTRSLQKGGNYGPACGRPAGRLRLVRGLAACPREVVDALAGVLLSRP